jgi:hypothetical protein
MCTAFEGQRRIAGGELAEVAAAAKEVVDRGPSGPVLVFDNETSEQVEIDFRGRLEDVVSRLRTPAKVETNAEHSDEARRRGRPKLGVVAREVTLLPRHWDWLNRQPGGASVALRKLVDEARRTSGHRDRVRGSQEVAYRFMSALAGDLPGFEEASRALFAGNLPRFESSIAPWPVDVREHALTLARGAFEKRD